MHDSAACPVCRGKPIDGSMSDEAFAAFLNACRNELVEKQRRFQERIAGAERWHYDLETGSLIFDAQRFPMIPIGTHSPERQTWLWAWANQDFPDVARQASLQFQSLHAITGFGAFLDPGIDASSVDAQDFSALAIHISNAIGLFRAPTAGPTLYLTVLERLLDVDESSPMQRT
jgi:uncharacterized protein DUF6882